MAAPLAEVHELPRLGSHLSLLLSKIPLHGSFGNEPGKSLFQKATNKQDLKPRAINSASKKDAVPSRERGPLIGKGHQSLLGFTVLGEALENPVASACQFIWLSRPGAKSAVFCLDGRASRQTTVDGQNPAAVDKLFIPKIICRA